MRAEYKTGTFLQILVDHNDLSLKVEDSNCRTMLEYLFCYGLDLVLFWLLAIWTGSDNYKDDITRDTICRATLLCRKLLSRNMASRTTIFDAIVFAARGNTLKVFQ